jgi:D-aminopeptidase
MLTQSRKRARDMGINFGRFKPGEYNAITDVPGVRVGQSTLISGEGALKIGEGPVRTGVTVVIPGENIQHDPMFAGAHILNGCGEMTGLAWIGEAGKISSPIAITNTFSVGVVHDALIALDTTPGLPVVAETWDGWLNDIKGMHVRLEHVKTALESASSGEVSEGCVGGGTGMICHGFKGGIGTSSRVLPEAVGGWTVGVLVQANHGDRKQLRVDGVPVGREIPHEEVPTPFASFETVLEGGSSIIVVVATNAPLLPMQCRRLAQRATLGVGRAGGLGENTSGDIFIAFSTANRGLYGATNSYQPIDVQMLPDHALDYLFEAVSDATEESIVNALCAATTMSGVDGRTVYRLPLDRLAEVMQKYGRLD